MPNDHHVILVEDVSDNLSSSSGLLPNKRKRKSTKQLEILLREFNPIQDWSKDKITRVS